MATIMGQKYTTDWRGRPPHMLQQDIPVWYRFLKQNAQNFIGLWYDVMVGGPTLTPEEELDIMKKMWRDNTSKRIDAITETETEVWIIEVSDYPGMRAVGQVFTYQSLWLEDPKIAKLERLAIVCARIDTDIAAAMGKMGVLIFILPDPDAGPIQPQM